MNFDETILEGNRLVMSILSYDGKTKRFIDSLSSIADSREPSRDVYQTYGKVMVSLSLEGFSRSDIGIDLEVLTTAALGQGIMMISKDYVEAFRAQESNFSPMDKSLYHMLLDGVIVNVSHDLVEIKEDNNLQTYFPETLHRKVINFYRDLLGEGFREELYSAGQLNSKLHI